VNLPATLTSISGNHPFQRCVNLTTITVDSGNPNYTARNGMLLDKAGTTLIAYPSAKGTVTESGITTIGNYAFRDCDALATVDLPAATSIGSYAFYNCDALTTVSLPAATSIGTCAFRDCDALTEVSLPEATSIEIFAFANTGGTPLTITLGNTPPTVVANNTFVAVSVPKTVTVKVPSDAAANYDNTWQEAFKGSNSNISLTVVEE
jgi:hypothetical protein